ncbi:MAG: glycosyltransferase family 2 protein [Verrucomicrobiota bacterium]|nr:glycosyltransferase family 2 protein [Verrucomicrobiota bacterium]
MPRASIIVRSMNDIDYIERTLQAITEQKFTDFELVNIDCGSTDGTYEIIKKFNSKKVFQMNPTDYVPGKVLNDMIKECDGKYIVFNNSDCIPQNKIWLENLLHPLQKHENTVAVYGRQITRPNARPLVVKDGERAFGTDGIARTWKHFFSLATSAAKHKILEKHPFNPDIQYSEDVEWSYRMKKKGFEIEYAPDAIVEHSHNYSLSEVRKRFYNEGYAEGEIYGENVSFFRGVLLSTGAEVLRDLIYLGKNLDFVSIPHGIIYRILQKYSIYCGRADYFNGKKKR